MKIFKWLIISGVFTVAGIYLGVCQGRYSALADEYGYFLRINNILYDVKDKNVGSLRGDMNNLLYMHFNRYLVHRQAMPSFLIAEVDGLMCDSFAMTPDTFKVYKEQIDTKVYEYINKHLNFCSFTLDGLGNVDRI